ncbi:hypothetical protein [Schumannella sp. 10F1B-5-1]|uniref:hypothetical protein n=1 Tax=Schumannella sp. 10F1B-5-1 TaxID=2590780 RepID=UPI0015E84BEC|nr:hypothetical protein [Schumannella sp. 10F1B-5-1]
MPESPSDRRDPDALDAGDPDLGALGVGDPDPGVLDAGELARLDALPLGWSRIQIAGEPWGVTRTEHAGGRSTTLAAERLGGRGYLSANVWRTAAGVLLKPCEIPAEQVHEFLRALPDSGSATSDDARAEPHAEPL